MIFSRLKELFPSLQGQNFSCFVCGKEVFKGEYLCQSCAAAFPFNNQKICLRCGRRQREEGYCLDCKARLPVADKLRSAAVYEGAVPPLVIGFKEGKRYLAPFLVGEMKKVFDREFADAEAITYVPMYPRDRRARGYNQSRCLAEELSRLTGVPCVRYTEKFRPSKKQKSLGALTRRENLAGCFRLVDRSCKHKRVLLVDDVLTTGATGDAVAALLKKAKADKVYMLTFASVEYKM